MLKSTYMLIGEWGRGERNIANIPIHKWISSNTTRMLSLAVGVARQTNTGGWMTMCSDIN